MTVRERGREKLEGRPRREREETEEEVKARRSREVRKLHYAGKVRRFMRRGTYHVLADSPATQVLHQMRLKFPTRNDPLPAGGWLWGRQRLFCVGCPKL